MPSIQLSFIIISVFQVIKSDNDACKVSVTMSTYFFLGPKAKSFFGHVGTITGRPQMYPGGSLTRKSWSGECANHASSEHHASPSDKQLFKFLFLDQFIVFAQCTTCPRWGHLGPAEMQAEPEAHQAARGVPGHPGQGPLEHNISFRSVRLTRFQMPGGHGWQLTCKLPGHNLPGSAKCTRSYSGGQAPAGLSAHEGLVLILLNPILHILECAIRTKRDTKSRGTFIMMQSRKGPPPSHNQSCPSYQGGQNSLHQCEA